jgi:hypothetical protein
MVVAAVLVVPMMWLKRLLMVVGPATYDTMTGAFGRYHFTWVPVAITLAATAAVPLLLMLLFRVIPLLSIDEIDEIDEANEIQEMEKHLTELPHAAPREPADHDGNLVGALGIPVLDGLGAEGKGAHAHDEQIRLDALPVRTQLLAGLLEDPGV